MLYPWEEKPDSIRSVAKKTVPAKASRLPAVRHRKQVATTYRTASSWTAARRIAVGQVQKNVPTGASSTTPVGTATVPPPVTPASQTPTRVNGKVPTNDEGFLVKLGSQAGFRGRWYCGRLLDSAVEHSDQCGPEGGPQCNSCTRFQSMYEPDLNDDGFPVKRSASISCCFFFYCGRPGVVASTGGQCGPDEGPQCPSCRRLQESFKAHNVNDEGCTMLRGTGEGYKGTFYCGRVLGVKAIPGSDGRCGPQDGPQCDSCRRFQLSQQIIIDDDVTAKQRKTPVRAVAAAAAAQRAQAAAVAPPPARAAPAAPASPAAPAAPAPAPSAPAVPAPAPLAVKVKAEAPAEHLSGVSEAAHQEAEAPRSVKSIQRSGSSSPSVENDEGCTLVKGTAEGYTETYYCGRKLGAEIEGAGSDGRCGPDSGPQCASCRRFQMSLEADVNDAGVLVKLGTEYGFTSIYFCGRGFTSETGAEFRCGPAGGPQCTSCRRFQMLRRRRARDPQQGAVKVKQETPSAQPSEKTPSAQPSEKTASPPTAVPKAVASKPASSKKRKQSEQPIRRTALIQDATKEQPPVPQVLLCMKCKSGEREAELLLCDGPGCKNALHMSCCRPKLKEIPEGDWFCPKCQSSQQKKAKATKSKAPEVSPAPPAAPAVVAVCSECHQGNRPAELLLCDGPGCNRATHLGCCNPPLSEIPEGEWLCSTCRPPSRPVKRSRQPASPGPSRGSQGAVANPQAKASAKGMGKGLPAAPSIGEALQASSAKSAQAKGEPTRTLE